MPWRADWRGAYRTAAAQGGGEAAPGLNQTGWGIPPGQACVSDFPCANSYPELGIAHCADNGYADGAYGGAKHCCRYAGGSRGDPLSDDDPCCCGSRACLGGRGCS